MTESELSEEYDVCLKLVPCQLANTGATSHVQNNLNIVGVGYTAQKQKFGLAYALFFQKLHYFWAYTEVTGELSIYLQLT